MGSLKLFQKPKEDISLHIIHCYWFWMTGKWDADQGVLPCDLFRNCSMWGNSYVSIFIQPYLEAETYTHFPAQCTASFHSEWVWYGVISKLRELEGKPETFRLLYAHCVLENCEAPRPTLLVSYTKKELSPNNSNDCFIGTLEEQRDSSGQYSRIMVAQVCWRVAEAGEKFEESWKYLKDKKSWSYTQGTLNTGKISWVTSL